MMHTRHATRIIGAFRILSIRMESRRRGSWGASQKRRILRQLCGSHLLLFLLISTVEGQTHAIAGVVRKGRHTERGSDMVRIGGGGGITLAAERNESGERERERERRETKRSRSLVFRF